MERDRFTKPIPKHLDAISVQKYGTVAGARVVNEGGCEEVMLVSVDCQVFRTSLSEISRQGRDARGIILWRPDDGDEVASIACF